MAEIKHSTDARSLLTSLDVAESDGTALRLRQAGVLFFAKEPQRFLRESHVTAVRYEGTDRLSVVDRAELMGDPVAMIEDTMRFIRRNVSARQIITGEARHREVREYPLVAIREAIINAVMHRDYCYDASHTYVHVFADRLEVENPGGLPIGMQIEDLGKRSVRRNRVIADLLFRAHYVERIGSGIQRMERALAENGNPPMEISASNFFVLKFYPSFPQSGSEVLTPRQSQLCQHLAGLPATCWQEELRCPIDFRDRWFGRRVPAPSARAMPQSSRRPKPSAPATDQPPPRSTCRRSSVSPAGAPDFADLSLLPLELLARGHQFRPELLFRR